MQGWSKATPSVRKRLLRRTIKEIVVTRAEMLITFWVSAEERDDAILPGDEADSQGAGNLIKLRRLSPPVVNRNLSIESSGNIKIVSERQT